MKHNFSELLNIYRSELLDSIIPFWIKYAIDWKNGGILTCISDEGNIISEDKYLWSQLRAIWTFSALYNKIEKKQEWLNVAKCIFNFVKKYGRDDEGRWLYCVDKNGKPLQEATSIYSDGFAIYGLTELARATGEKDIIDIVLETYENVQKRLAHPGSYRSEPYPIPKGMKAHSISMIFSLVFNELGHYLNSQEIIDASLFHAGEVMDVFLRSDQKLVYEYVGSDNTLIDSPQGRAVVPGHAIESMWFMIHIYQREHNEKMIQKAVEAIRWHIEFGWDHEYGGILLSRDAQGKSPWWEFADSKLWWPHTEALYALLLSYEISKEDWCLEWFDHVHEYAFAHYPVAEYGEWTQRLDRKGNKFTETVALPVKDPFHLPRAVIYIIEVLQRLIGKEVGSGIVEKRNDEIVV